MEKQKLSWEDDSTETVPGEKSRTAAIIIAVLLSLFVWLYIGKYKKFCFTFGLITLSVLISWLLDISIIGKIVGAAVWILAIIDAANFKEVGSGVKPEL